MFEAVALVLRSPAEMEASPRQGLACVVQAPRR